MSTFPSPPVTSLDAVVALAQSRAIIWIARAAAHEHVIAQEQLAALVAAVVPPAAQP